MFALDERLRLHGLAPVFEAEREAEHDHDHDHDHHHDHDHDHTHHAQQVNGQATEASAAKGASSEAHKIGRNDPCPCGSGKKYKQCHGR
jgi:preprotein translocase subunit SecA